MQTTAQMLWSLEYVVSVVCKDLFRARFLVGAYMLTISSFCLWPSDPTLVQLYLNWHAVADEAGSVEDYCFPSKVIKLEKHMSNNDAIHINTKEWHIWSRRLIYKIWKFQSWIIHNKELLSEISRADVYVCVCACPVILSRLLWTGFRGGWDKYVSPSPQAVPKDPVLIYSFGAHLLPPEVQRL